MLDTKLAEEPLLDAADLSAKRIQTCFKRVFTRMHAFVLDVLMHVHCDNPFSLLASARAACRR